MATVALQLGHCFRTKGSTGTAGEQQHASAVASLAADGARLLRAHGHTVHLLLADERVPPTDLFAALHCDGSVHESAGGASVGYRSARGQHAASIWKRQYQRRGWPHGFRRDNYTAALAGYYGVRWAEQAGTRHAFIIEHGFLTNPSERQLLQSQRGRLIAAYALLDTVGEIYGHPTPPQEDWLDMATKQEVQEAFTAALAPLLAELRGLNRRVPANLADTIVPELRVNTRHVVAASGRDPVGGDPDK